MAGISNASDKKDLWYKDAVIYELHIKAFFDSNGDGIGDFAGLLQKLDYVQELGVTAVWVLPFYPSPLRDDGYDIADYYTINPRYGNLEQFQQFLAEAHKRNLKVITELVINHTSDQHKWFQRARRAPKGSDERNYYVWTDDPTQYKDVRIIFTDTETSNWTWDPVAQQYYWHRFFHHQPDLNYDSPLVQEEIFRIVDYWASMGVDGFRLDAVPYLYEREGTNGENLPETHAYLKRLRAHAEERYPRVCFLAEANMWPEDSASYFGNGDECHMNYHFPVMPRMYMALQKEDRYPITDIFDQTPPIPENCQWAIFLRNHDELTLEMVTDEERDYMYTAYAKDPKAKINLGIRHRLAPLMDNDRRRIELMNCLLFSLPGTPVIYYGDEIGMGDNFYLGDRDGVRTPMQWSPDRNAGFSDTNPQRLYLPVILDPLYHYESVNVETQRASTSSLFWFMKRIINLRKRHKAFSRGDMRFLHVDNPKILAFTRTFAEESMLVLVNFSKYSQPAEIIIDGFAGYTPVEAFSQNPFPAIKNDAPYFFTLGPHAYQWFVLQKPTEEAPAHQELPTVTAAHFDDAFIGTAADVLASDVLPGYLQRVKWFTGKGKSLDGVSIAAHTAVPVGEGDAEVLLLQVTFLSGLPEYYSLPVAFVSEEEAKVITVHHPAAVMAKAIINESKGFLCDALYVPAFQHAVLQLLAGNKRFMSRGEVVFHSVQALPDQLTHTPHLEPKAHDTSEMHTALAYGKHWYLKMFRRVDQGIHPDVEITKLLTTSGLHATKYAGTIEWTLNDGVFCLGLLEHMEESHGDGHHYMLERVSNFIERILARDRAVISSYPKKGSLTAPVAFEELPNDLKEFIGHNAAEVSKQVGRRLAQVHKALAESTDAAFVPEEFSLHYQRSLFSSMTSLVREMGQAIEKNNAALPDGIREEVIAVNDGKEKLLDTLRKIYSRKLDVPKIRTHGNVGLSHVMLTGKDVVLHDFGGNPLRPYSERRLKRSPLLDVAAMLRSFHYVAYEGFFASSHIPTDVWESLLPFADFWAHYNSGFFMRAYLDEVKGTGFLPADKSDFETLVNTFVLENAIHWLTYEVGHRPERAVIPLRIVQKMMA